MEKAKTKDFTIEEKSQRGLKGISKFLYIMANIIKVFAIIGIVGMVIAMLCIPTLTKNIKTSEVDGEKIISIFDQEFSYTRTDEGYTLIEKGNEDNKIIIKDDSDIETINKVFNYIEKNDLSRITIFIEVAFALIIASLVIEIFVMKKAHNLFKNIYDEDTPFTTTNIDLLKSIGKLLIYTVLLNILANLVISYAFNTEVTIQITNIFEILIAFLASYIFEYGYKLQQSTKGSIYTEE